MLKSPVMMNSWGVVVASDRNAEKSAMKDWNGVVYADESGGR